MFFCSLSQGKIAMSNKSNLVLGVDFGGVICARVKTPGESYLPMLNCFDVLKRFNALGWVIHIVSRADSDQEEIIQDWLLNSNFYTITKVMAWNVHFCQKREEKANICQKLGITDFIDDRAEVLMHLFQARLERLQRLYLFSAQEEESKPYAAFLPHFRSTNSWLELEQMLLE